MMETETRRAVPSRYKTVRRKTQTTAPAVPSLQPVHPNPTQQAKYRPQQSHPVQSPVQQQQRSLVDQVSSPKQPSRPKDKSRAEVNQTPEAHHEHASRFRRMLRLHGSAKEEERTHAPERVSEPPKKLAKSAVLREPEGPTAADLERQRAREEAVLALEGKRPSSKPKTPPMAPKPAQQPYDLHISLHFEKKPTVEFPIHNHTTAGALLEQVRPGHERYLIERWPSLGLQRQVRYFEPVSDVHNTWDAGSKSHVRVTKTAWGTTNRKLDGFPRCEPPSGEASFYYYVTADKKWVKRTISLDNTSIRILKKDKPYDKDYLQTITMENFDIYSFSEPFVPEKKLRCPTKFCFAVKSQHKQSLFGKNSVFVHYFAVDNEALFTHWFGLIRDLKTRLLAEKKGLAWWIAESNEAENECPQLPPIGSTPTSPSRRQQKPLISADELAQPPTQATTTVSRSKSLHRNKTTRQPGRNRAASAAVPQNGLVGPVDEEAFIPGSLLGAGYEEKKKEALKNYKDERSNPFAVNTLLSKDTSPVEPPPTSYSANSAEHHHGLQRKPTVSRPATAHQGGTLLAFGHDEIPPPLPNYRRGRGVTVSGKEGAGLISHATTLYNDEPHPLPTPKRYHTVKARSRGMDEEASAFTGHGLLAGNIQSAGAARYGHGVKTGRDAIGKNGEINPLMDMTDRGVFAPGSLLEQRARQIGPAKPVIDRDPHSSDSDH